MKASVFIATSLDGLIARTDGALDWLPQPESAEEFVDESDDMGYGAFMDSVDALVMGRHTYEQVLAFDQWPYGEKPVIVLSSGTVDIPGHLAKRVEAASASPRALISQLEDRGIQHIYVDGGRTIQSFLNEGLIQQIIITRIPVLIGSGIPLFGPLAQDVKLRHVATKTLPDGMVQSTYEVIE